MLLPLPVGLLIETYPLSFLYLKKVSAVFSHKKQNLRKDLSVVV